MATAHKPLNCNCQLPHTAISGPDFASYKGKWPLLEHLTIIGFAKLNQAQVTALIDTAWTSLRSLHIEPLDSALPDLFNSNWPKLTELSIGGGLSDEGLGHLSSCPWSTLQCLQLVDCKFTSKKMKGLFQAYLPQLKELSFKRVSSTDATGIVKGCFALFLQGSWPELSLVALENGYADSVSALARSNWFQISFSDGAAETYRQSDFLTLLFHEYLAEFELFTMIGVGLQKQKSLHITQAKVAFV